MLDVASTRADLNGLRALGVVAALMLVVAPNWIPGGRGGLDILFVVAGFLVTTTVLEQASRGSFELRAWYGRRIRRAFPAVLVVIAASLIAGWFLLFEQEYRELGRDIAGGFLVFGAEQPSRILLHLHQVAVLLPLYVLWPPVLLALRQRLPLLALLVGVVFVLSLWGGFIPGMTLMMGCGLTLGLRHGWQWHGVGAERASILAICVIIVGLALNLRDWPRFLPAIGAAVLISTGPSTWVARRVLGSGLAAGIAAIAHPLYLWFWPLASFLFIHETGLPSQTARIGIFALASIAAVVTHLFVERPMRRFEQRKGKTIGLVAAAGIAGFLGAACLLSGGFPGTGYRDGAGQRWFNSLDVAAASIGCTEQCAERDPSRPHAVLLWGDGHAREIYAGLKRHLPADWQILQVAQLGCLPDTRVTGPSAEGSCAQSNWVALRTITNTKPDVVIVAQERGQLIRSYNATGSILAGLDVTRTLFVGPTPHWRADLPAILARHFWPDMPQRTWYGIDSSVRGLNDTLIEYFSTTDRQAYVDVFGTFCNTTGCLTHLGPDTPKALTSADRSHLTPIASDYLAREVLVRMVVGSLHK